MATISNTPRPGYVWDATDNCWYPIGTGPHSHADYITSSSAINPNIVDAKGDIIAATAADTVARLAVGSNDQVLTADSSTATGLKWATPTAGAYTSIATGSLSGTSTSISSIPGSYQDLLLVVKGYTNAPEDAIGFRFNNITGGYDWVGANNGATSLDNNSNGDELVVGGYTKSTNLGQATFIYLSDYASSSGTKTYFSRSVSNNGTSWRSSIRQGSVRTITGALTSIQIFTTAGATWTGGTYTLYGVK